MNEEADQPVDPGAEQAPDWKNSLSHVLRERAFFYLMVGVLVLLTLILIWPYLSPILLGLAAVVITKPIFDWFLDKNWLRGRTKWAVTLTIISSILLIAVPVALFLGIAFNQATAVFSGVRTSAGGLSPHELQQAIASFVSQVGNGEGVGFDAAARAEWRQGISDTFNEWLGGLIAAIGQSIPAFIVNAVIVLVIMMVLLPLYRQPNRGNLAAAIPFPSAITDLYLDKVQMMMRAMFLGTFVIAFAQGAAMGVVFWLAGVPSSVFLALVSMVLSLLPVIGVALVAWPVAILLLLGGNVWQAIFVIVMLIVVVGNIDTLLRPMLVPRGAYLNPALTLLAIFGGLQLMGLVGALYGPVIMILLVTSIEVYSKYILRNDLEPYLDEEGTLSLEKLGLAATEDESDKENSGLAGLANRMLGRIWSARDTEPEPIQDSDAGTK